MYTAGLRVRVSNIAAVALDGFYERRTGLFYTTSSAGFLAGLSFDGRAGRWLGVPAFVLLTLALVSQNID